MTRAKKNRLLGTLASWLLRVLFATLRYRFHDHAGVLTSPPPARYFWCFWHNRLLITGYMHERFFPTRRGAALASQSQDGEVIAGVVSAFGIRPIRGSSSRGGARALVEMKRAHEEGFDVAITPDGPRGPKYRVGPGLVKLAQLTGGKVLLTDITYSRCWRLRSWDGFMIPKPFATATFTYAPLYSVAPTATEEEFEAERLKLEKVFRELSGD